MSSLSFSNGNCIEMASLPYGGVDVRPSWDRAGRVLRFTPDEWHAFIGGVRNDEFVSFGLIDFRSRSWPVVVKRGVVGLNRVVYVNLGSIPLGGRSDE